MKNQKLAFVVCSVILFGALCTRTIFAASTGTVAATVTAQNVSITVGDGTIAYGTMATNASKSTVFADLNDAQAATNSGNVTEDFYIKGSNSANWTLDTANSTTDHYIHKYCKASDINCLAPATNYTALTTSDQVLATGVAASGFKKFELQLTTPQTSSVFTSQSVDVTITAAAS